MLSEEQIHCVVRGLDPIEIRADESGLVTCTVDGIGIVIPVEEFLEYLRIKDEIVQTGNTSLYVPGYFEQAIEFQNRRTGLFRLLSEKDDIRLVHEPSSFKVEVSPISSKLVFKNTDSSKSDRDFRRLAMLRRSRLRDKESVSLDEAFSKILSVKVFSPDGHILGKNLKQLRAIAEAALFNIAYGLGVGVISIQSWERSINFLRTNRRESIQFPLRTYNHELVGYYQMAVTGESLILSYLALYKILEFFFTSAAERVLHSKVKEQLVAPDFTHTRVAKLRELVKTVRRFDQKMDERRMLQTVLEQNIDKEQLIAWIEEFENHKNPYFTVENDVFGELLKVDFSENQFFPSLSNRIYHIRNVLVHNKEGETARFKPFSGQERILLNEAPLLKRLAEDLIISTGKDIQF